MPNEEGYELRTPLRGEDDEPLLPRYERTTHSDSSHHTSHAQQLSRQLEIRRHSRFRRAVSCLCLALFIVIPSFGLAGCWFGREAINRAKQWEQLPEEWKSWLNQIAPGKAAPDPGNFPVDVGYAGPTPTGNEANLMATAPSLPMFTGVSPLVPPDSARGSFNIMQYWGNLSPYFSVDSHGLPEAQRVTPETCQVESLHWLQRHGARYPTTMPGGPEGFARRMREVSGWEAHGDLSFLNDYTYQLGREILTPFGRQQLFNLGVAARLKYGHLLEKMNGRLPVFRTESQDRMLRSAQNFATGFFGYPAESQYNLEVMIESPGFNCSLAPWGACDLSYDDSQRSGWEKMHAWENVFLEDARERLNGLITGYDFSIADVADMMDTCAYETVALGYSSFCTLFTVREWRGYEYRNDISWWYTASFGWPYAKPLGKAWLQELVSRLTHTRITDFDSAINSTLHDDIHFPLNDVLHFDFTHDTLFAILLSAMNLTTFAESGDPPVDRMPKHRSFIAAKCVRFPFIQVLSCTDQAAKQIRLIWNDAPVPLVGIRNCPDDEEGLCPLETFVAGLQELIDETDFQAACGPKS
ncbi:histidine phosphatase superfamily [Kockovaella imperatae]|uniref:Histidine phosphatase superfamily n=1 Tax=Kockovaella imperatae TaxID=4999 RepID=A0A1Y1UL42_9TREE|nr:histidine phosphatase superfamily [Kockovaella imperatae]ORX38214.1 histidine phosphatase superfamily [Kockovaella imperatae]